MIFCAERTINYVQSIRSSRPIVACITNSVTNEFVANSLLAIGASPIMYQDPRETADIISQSQALYINIGTINEALFELMHQAAIIANKLQKPVVLDPVGAGFTLIRTKAAKSFIGFSNVIRGNADEIAAIVEAPPENSVKKGVDSSSCRNIDNLLSLVHYFSRINGITVVVTGKDDYIINTEAVSRVSFGSPIMRSITGMGCALSSIISAFCAISGNYTEASHAATAYFSMCGQYAAKKSNLPGSFRCHFIDILSSMSEAEMLSF
ncbi:MULTISPECIES: hydroxyethylthiazole kinase [Candidatus Ichthyocystis]|uniref:Hydroxyethylthiazole kinase n=1 Tax=Candidatus Ichthyocystis hellenicum TaxID=1561003 RepID=A0A0S4M214_9BURK|nr:MULTISPECIES: hydroxyethylthiazole kinase [Ichthyocystis]CUT17726.1 Hydroxyethylthiazole kinase [Candidatus Ichthyocystis hellenicum]